MKRHGNWVIKVVLVLLAMLWLSVVAASWSAAAEDESDSSSVKGGEYNFSWLDPEKKIYVLQNRRYTKANHVLLSLSGGFASTSAYRTSYSIDPKLTYYFSEQWGVGAFYQYFSNKPNSTAESLSTTSVSPDVIEVKNQLGVLLYWAPWYAKINVFNSILYFDWFFTGGVGSMNANLIPGSGQTGVAPTTGSFTTYYLGTGHEYHVNEKFVVRLDFLNTWFNAPSRATTGASTLFNSTTFELGVGLRL